MIWYMDNLGVFSALCSGYGSVSDFGGVIHAIHLPSARLQLRAWWEHVDSEANAADGGTRGPESMALQLGVALPWKALPKWPENVVRAPPMTWFDWLHSNML